MPACRSRGATSRRRSPLTPGKRQAISTYRDSAVVLRKLDYGESDRIYTLLTREHGKVGELAREPEPRRASAYFVMVALDLLGYAPQLSACASCGRQLRAAAAAFSPVAGGFLCENCAQPGMHLVGVSVLKVLRLMAAGEIGLYRRLKLDAGLMGEIEMLLEAQLEHHLDRQLRS